jgi:hypothetical protein
MKKANYEDFLNGLKSLAATADKCSVWDPKFRVFSKAEQIVHADAITAERYETALTALNAKAAKGGFKNGFLFSTDEMMAEVLLEQL